MILPIFLTNQFLSIKITGTDKDSTVEIINLKPVEDGFSPHISTGRIRELLKKLMDDNDLTEFNPVILSISEENSDIEPQYSFPDAISEVKFPVIVPEYYYSRAIDLIDPGAANIFLNCSKYGIEIPLKVKIQLDSTAISLYLKENIGKFISQNQIVVSAANVDSKSRGEYIEAIVKALSDNIQIAGVWNVYIDFGYTLFPNLIEAYEEKSAIDEFFDNFLNEVHGKLIIAPGVTELQVGEDENYETIELSPDKLNKFKVKEDDKVTFKWKSDKSKFDGEVYGSKTGIRIDVRERA